MQTYSDFFSDIEFISQQYVDDNIDLFGNITVNKEQFFYYVPLDIEDIYDTVIFEYYYQSYKYFTDCNNILMFKFRKYLQNKYSKICNIDFNNKVCVHIRRGDYTNYKMYYEIPEKHYEECLKYLYNENNNYVFLVFYAHKTFIILFYYFI
jgi:hypothetical protein